MNPNPPTPGPVDPDAAAQRANVLLESEINARLDAVRELARRQNALDAALADYESAWQLAARTGWTESTLRDIGLRAPDALPERPSRRAEASATRSEPEPASGPASSPTLAPVVSLPSAANASAAPVAPAASVTSVTSAAHAASVAPAAPAPLTPAAAFSPGAPGLGPAPTLP